MPGYGIQAQLQFGTRKLHDPLLRILTFPAQHERCILVHHVYQELEPTATKRRYRLFSPEFEYGDVGDTNSLNCLLDSGNDVFTRCWLLGGGMYFVMMCG